MCLGVYTVPLSGVHVCKVKGETKLTRGTKGQRGERRARRTAPAGRDAWCLKSKRIFLHVHVASEGSYSKSVCKQRVSVPEDTEEDTL